jgi:uncharacterized protein (DUF2267 family)
VEKSMQSFEDLARSAAGRVLDAILPVPAERLAEALTLDVVLELENHIADGKADEVADWAVRGCSQGLAFAAFWLGRPESVGWEWRPRAPFDETRRTVQSADQLDFDEQYNEQSPLDREQRAKAAEVLAVLRRHIPADQLREVEDFLSSGSGSDYVRYELQRDWMRKRLRKHMPAEHWQEIEDYLDSGDKTERVSAALDEEGLPF